MTTTVKAGLLVGLFSLLIQADGFAQSSKISGKVTDAETGEPLPGANVIIQGTVQGAAADLDGNYFIINLGPGEYTVAASIIGYTTLIQEEVSVVSGRTTTLDFALEPAVFEGEPITVTAKRELVPPDVSQSQQILQAETHIENQPVQSLEDLLNMQAGIEDMVIRGGGRGQTELMVDGFTLVDERRNMPVMTVNLNSIQEVEILTGGFNAEYGNIRSGMINITTKQGTVDRYSGSAELRMRPPALKHFGEEYWKKDWRTYAGPESQNGNGSFEGWRTFTEGSATDPEEAQALWEWQHRPRDYAHKPDYMGEVSLAGPVPLLTKLRPTSFFASARRNYEMFVVPVAGERDGVSEQNLQLKLTTQLAPMIRLSAFGLLNTQDAVRSGTARPGNRNNWGPMRDGGSNAKYGMGFHALASLTTNLLGLELVHTLGNATFYTVNLQRFHRKDHATHQTQRDTTARFEYYPGRFTNEAPFGWHPASNRDQLGWYQLSSGGTVRDFSETETMKAKVDLTSQINTKNQIKTGFEITYNRLDEEAGSIEPWHNNQVYWYLWEREPIRGGAYIQDKLEWEGMVANVGLRFDYSDARVDWYTVDRYSRFLSDKGVDRIDEVPTERSKKRTAVSPRLGVSFPISENTKFFLNYGHFYSMPYNEALFGYQQGAQSSNRITLLGNPSLELPKTVAYEVGYEQNLFDEVLLHVAGYYKDVTNQSGLVGYHSRDYSVSYETYENKHYADIKGFEIRAEKDYGRFLWGWLNYNYVLVKEGFVGVENYYEDPRVKADIEGAEAFTNVPQPLFRASLDVHTPRDWGAEVAGMRPLGGWAFNFLYTWQAGDRFTWRPENPEERNNMQWVDYQNTDLRISKRFGTPGGARSQLFITVTNLFNIKRLRQGAFDGQEWTEYLESLKLPWYSGEAKGNDKVGIDDKDYLALDIREPHLMYFNPRHVQFGLRVNF